MKKEQPIFSFIAVFLISICLFQASSLAVYETTYQSEYGSGIVHDPYSANALSYEKLKAFIQTKKIKSIDQLLFEFSKQEEYQSYLKQFTLMYKSKSRHKSEVSRENPRIVLFKDRMVLGMAGRNSGTDLSNSLEIIDFNPKTYQFEFHMIQFKDNAYEFIDEPVSCKECHNGQPIWAKYPFWPGAFGSFDSNVLYAIRENLYGLAKKQLGSHPRYVLDRIDKEAKAGKLKQEPKETEAYTNFLERGRTKDRFQYLNWDLHAIAYSNTSAPNSLANNELSRFFKFLNLAKIMHELDSRKDMYSKYKYAIAAALSECRNIPEFLPKTEREKLNRALNQRFNTKGSDEQELLQKIEAHLVDTLKEEQTEKFKDFLSATESSIPLQNFLESFGASNSSAPIRGRDLVAMKNLFYLMEGQGISMRNWAERSLPRRPSYDFFTGTLGIRDLLHYQVIPDLFQSDPYFVSRREELLSGTSSFKQFIKMDRANLCSLLKEKSLEAFAIREQTGVIASPSH